MEERERDADIGMHRTKKQTMLERMRIQIIIICEKSGNRMRQVSTVPD